MMPLSWNLRIGFFMEHKKRDLRGLQALHATENLAASEERK